MHATKLNENNVLEAGFSVAPMMDWTDRAGKPNTISAEGGRVPKCTEQSIRI
jgi:hypothetical protein